MLSFISFIAFYMRGVEGALAPPPLVRKFTDGAGGVAIPTTIANFLSNVDEKSPAIATFNTAVDTDFDAAFGNDLNRIRILIKPLLDTAELDWDGFAGDNANHVVFAAKLLSYVHTAINQIVGGDTMRDAAAPEVVANKGLLVRLGEKLKKYIDDKVVAIGAITGALDTRIADVFAKVDVQAKAGSPAYPGFFKFVKNHNLLGDDTPLGHCEEIFSGTVATTDLKGTKYFGHGSTAGAGAADLNLLETVIFEPSASGTEVVETRNQDGRLIKKVTKFLKYDDSFTYRNAIGGTSAAINNILTPLLDEVTGLAPTGGAVNVKQVKFVIEVETFDPTTGATSTLDGKHYEVFNGTAGIKTFSNKRIFRVSHGYQVYSPVPYTDAKTLLLDLVTLNGKLTKKVDVLFGMLGEKQTEKLDQSFISSNRSCNVTDGSEATYKNMVKAFETRIKALENKAGINYVPTFGPAPVQSSSTGSGSTTTTTSTSDGLILGMTKTTFFLGLLAVLAGIGLLVFIFFDKIKAVFSKGS